MKINYKQMPFLAAIESGTLLNPDYPIRNYVEDDYAPVLIKTWLLLNEAMKRAYKAIQKNVVVVSDSYMDALARSRNAFNTLVEKDFSAVSKEIYDCSGCYVFPDAGQKDVRLAYIYHSTPELQLAIGIVDNDTIAYAYVSAEGKFQKFVTKRDIADGGQDAIERYFIQNFVYLRLMEKYAKVETRVIPSGAKVRLNPRYLEQTTNTSKLNVKYRDSRWFTEIIRNEGFTVSGHFRLQPKKVNGEWTRELIYINEFQKHGYHRRASIEI